MGVIVVGDVDGAAVKRMVEVRTHETIIVTQEASPLVGAGVVGATVGLSVGHSISAAMKLRAPLTLNSMQQAKGSKYSMQELLSRLKPLQPMLVHCCWHSASVDAAMGMATAMHTVSPRST